MLSTDFETDKRMKTDLVTCGELHYILDPKEVHGEDFPGETFLVVKEKEVCIAYIHEAKFAKSRKLV